MIKHLIMGLMSVGLATHTMDNDHRLTISYEVAKIIAEKNPAILYNTKKIKNQTIISRENAQLVLQHNNSRQSLHILNTLYQDPNSDIEQLLESYKYNQVKQFCHDYDKLGFTEQARRCVHYWFDEYKLGLHQSKKNTTNLLLTFPLTVSHFLPEDEKLITKYCDSIEDMVDSQAAFCNYNKAITYQDGCLTLSWPDLRRLQELAILAQKIREGTYLKDEECSADIDRIRSIKFSKTKIQVLDIAYLKTMFPSLNHFLCTSTPIEYINAEGIQEGDSLEINSHDELPPVNLELLAKIPPCYLDLGSTLDSTQKQYFNTIYNKTKIKTYIKKIGFDLLTSSLFGITFALPPLLADREKFDEHDIYASCRYLFIMGFFLLFIPRSLRHLLPVEKKWIKIPSAHPSKTHSIGWAEGWKEEKR